MGQFCILRRNNISKTVEVFLVIVKLVLFSRWRCLESYYHAVFIYEPKTIIPSQQTNPDHVWKHKIPSENADPLQNNWLLKRAIE